MHLAKSFRCAHAAIDLAALAHEAVGHVECQATNGGFAKSKLQTHTSALADSLNLRVVTAVTESGSSTRRLAPMLLRVGGEDRVSEDMTLSLHVPVSYTHLTLPTKRIV